MQPFAVCCRHLFVLKHLMIVTCWLLSVGFWTMHARSPMWCIWFPYQQQSGRSPFFSTSIHWIPHKDIIHENRNYTVVFTRFSQSCTSQTIGATAQLNTCSLERHLIEVARSTVLQELAAVGSSTNFRITLYPVKPLRCHWIFPVSIETSAELSGMHASSGTLPLVPPEFSGGRKTLLQPDALSSDVDVFHAPKLSGDSGAAESYVLHLFLRCLRSSTRVTRCTLWPPLPCSISAALCSGFLMSWLSSMFCIIFWTAS